MGVRPAIFESAGKRSEHLIPGAYSRNNTVSAASGGVSSSNGVVMGQSIGGKPNVIYWFSSVAEAADVLVSGPLLEAVAHAFNPGGGYTPQKIGAMRVNPGTQSVRSLKASAVEILSVKSWAFGVHANQLKMWLKNGTLANSKRVDFSYKGSDTITDNIILDSFSLIYTGLGSACSVTITKTGITTTCTGAAGDDQNISFASFATIGELVSKFNDTSVYTAILLDTSSSAVTTNLDTVSGVAIKAGVTTFRSNMYALKLALEASPYVDSVTFNDTQANRIVPDVDAGYIYFSGAVDGAYTVTEWAASLTAMETEDVQMIATHSTDNAVHTLIKNHCVAMSSVTNRRERSFLLGGAIGESVDNAIVAAKAFGTHNGSYCYPNIVTNNPMTGVVETVSAAIFACKLLGMEASVAVNEPLTWKSVDVLAWGKTLSVTDTGKLIQGGVLAGGITDDNRIAVIRAVTTNQSDDLQLCERSMVREANYMARDLRVRMTKMVGRPDVPTSGGSEESIFIMATKDWAGSGLIYPNDNGDFYWGLSIVKNGDQTFIRYNVYLTAPKNFFFITANNYVYSSIQSVAI